MKKTSEKPSPAVELRVQLYRRNMRYCDAVQAANGLLKPKTWLTETSLSKIITGRQRVKPEQAQALAITLNCTVSDLFPELEDVE